MKIAYFDSFSGISGDMILAALLDCEGVDENIFRQRLAHLQVTGFELIRKQVVRNGISATDIDVRLDHTTEPHGRHLSDITAIIEQSNLSSQTRLQNCLNPGRLQSVKVLERMDPRAFRHLLRGRDGF